MRTTHSMTGRAVALAAVASLGLAACSSSSSGGTPATGAAGAAVKGGTLKMALQGDVFYGFDPTKEYYSVSWEFLRCCLTRTLLSYNGKPGDAGGTDLFPDLASGQPDVSDDQLTWTFHLKDGIKFGDPLNREITAQDFVTAVDRIARVISGRRRRSSENAATSAPGTSLADAANLMPSAEPCAAGFTTTGNASRSSITGSASAAPSSLNAVSLNA